MADSRAPSDSQTETPSEKPAGPQMTQAERRRTPDPSKIPAPDAGGGSDRQRAAPSDSERPEAQTEDTREPYTLTPEAFRPLVRMPFSAWGQPLAEYETDALAEAWCRVYNECLSSWVGRGSPVAVALTVTAFAVAPRVQHGRAAKRDTARGGHEGERQDDSGPSDFRGPSSGGGARLS